MSSPLLTSYLVLWIVVLLLLLLCVAMVRQIGLLHRRIEPFGARAGRPGPAVGERAPSFDRTSLRGEHVTLGNPSPKKTLLVFISATCSTCVDLAPALRTVARSERAIADTLLVSSGTTRQVTDFVTRFHLQSISTIVASDLQAEYHVQSTPYALLVDEVGVVRAKGIINNLEQLESLFRAAEVDVEVGGSFVERPAMPDAPTADATEGTMTDA